MDKILSFKDLVVWQKSMELVENVYRLTLKPPQAERRGLMSQMRGLLSQFHQILPKDMVDKGEPNRHTIRSRFGNHLRPSHQRSAGRGDAPRSAVFIIGEDVAEAGTPFKVLSGLVKEFGKERVIDSPISEAGIAGIGVGAAMTGMRPVVDIMFGDFITLTMDQLVNQAAKIHYMSGGKLKVPMVLQDNSRRHATLRRPA